MIKKLNEIPKELTTLKNPPKNLYFLGNIELLNKRKVAIVGSRRASSYAKSSTFLLAKELASRDVVIVSGGAMGIDAIAHEGSFPNTIAIFANSLDLIYPQTNKRLITKIYQNALALSEYESNYHPRTFDFVIRNRLVVGLAELLIISEADIDSGSMRSAEIAIELKKEIYVLPHRLHESKGTQALLKKGKAKVIYEIEEFVSMFGTKKESKEDEFLLFCKSNPTVSEVVEKFGNKVYEYEIEGKIEIINGRVRIT